MTRVEQGEIVNEVSKIPEFIADEAIPRYVDKKNLLFILGLLRVVIINVLFVLFPNWEVLKEVEQ